GSAKDLASSARTEILRRFAPQNDRGTVNGVMERFDRKDIRFILGCLVVIAVGAAITLALFRRAFPEASIEFRVNRGEARAVAEKLLAGRGRDVSRHRFAGRFGVEDEPKVYLERELGLEKAGAFYGRDA